MAKRFTDTNKWNKPFIRGLQAPYKLLWLYILDECDHAGIWQVDIEVARIKIGLEFTPMEALKYFDNNILPISNGEKWFIKDFIEFQYGELNESNRAHASVIKILKHNKIDHIKLIQMEGAYKGHTSPLQGATYMDKDKDKDKDKDGDKKLNIPSEAEFLNYCQSQTDKFNLITGDLKLKYAAWVENGWKDGKNQKINNWKSKILQTIPYLIQNSNGKTTRSDSAYNPEPIEPINKEGFKGEFVFGQLPNSKQK
jgi:hypothetical protein